MKKIFIIAMLGFGISAQAQIKISLQQAINMGLENRYDLKAKQYNIDLAENQIEKDKKAWIPDIHAQGNLQYNTQLRSTVIPKGVFGLTEDQVVQMGTKNVTSFGLALNQPVYRPGINTDVQLSKTNMSLQEEKINGDKIVIKNNIATAYLNVLLKQLQLNIAKDEEQRFQTYEKLAEGKYQNGVLIKNDFLRAKLDFENAKVKTKTTQQNFDLALQFLKYQMNVPEDTQLFLTDSINDISLLALDTKTLQPLKNRTEIKQLKIQQQLAGLNIKKVHQNALPSISLVGYYAELYQNQDFHYNESKWWNPESYVGLQISVPITGNFRNKNAIRHYALQQQQLNFQLKQEQANVTYQVEKAAADLGNATENMQSAKANYALSQAIEKNQQQQFDIGVFNYSDLLDTEKSLDKTEQNYIQKVYDFLQAKIAYQVALGEW